MLPTPANTSFAGWEDVVALEPTHLSVGACLQGRCCCCCCCCWLKRARVLSLLSVQMPPESFILNLSCQPGRMAERKDNRKKPCPPERHCRPKTLFFWTWTQLKIFQVCFESKITIRTSWSTLHHFIIRELTSVINTPPIKPTNFWGFAKRNSQEKLHLFVLSLLGRSTPPIATKRFSEN